jgi:hypothetical protein
MPVASQRPDLLREADSQPGAADGRFNPQPTALNFYPLQQCLVCLVKQKVHGPVPISAPGTPATCEAQSMISGGGSLADARHRRAEVSG